MLYRHGTDHCGVGGEEMKALLDRLAPALEALKAGKNPQAAPLLAAVSKTSDMDEIETLAAEIRKRFDRVVVAGMGGSSLSGRALAQMMPGASALHFLENIDPETMQETLDSSDAEKTCFIIISKSGGTVETLSQFYILRDHVTNALGADGVRERFIVITEPGAGPLRQAAAEHGMRVLDHDPGIGGRFAILTVVGLLPAAIAGLDIRVLRRGAQSVIENMEAAASGAALQYAWMEKKYPVTVMLPYSQRLAGFAAWWRQCWAESLGKQGRGSTPVSAMGVTDQHSQLQLWLDGPKDKFFTMIICERAGRGPRITSGPDFLRGKTLGDVMEAEQEATLQTLIRNRCPVRVLRLESLGEAQMGALLMHSMLEILLTAALLGVDPFGQPAVEESKKLAREYLLKGNI